MNTDRELIEAAARVAGIEYEWDSGCGDALRLTGKGAKAIYWNPLRDDGDAFRLASILRLTVHHHELAVVIRHKQYSFEWIGEMVDADTGDRNASARKAIVRAAVAMRNGGKP